MPTRIPSRTPSVPPSFRPSTQPTFSPSATLPSVSPSSTMPSKNPTFTPSVMPSAAPSRNCVDLDSGDECRASNCAWDPHHRMCMFACDRIPDTGTTGVKIGDSTAVQNIDECEIFCLDAFDCVRFTFSIDKVCALYSSYDGEIYSLGTTSGVCLNTQIPTMMPTVYPTSAPTEVPTTTRPSTSPTITPSASPSATSPTTMPTTTPTFLPTPTTPSASPTFQPTRPPTTTTPSKAPHSSAPSTRPSMAPSANCPAIYSQQACRQSHCSWNPNHLSCSFSCHQIADTAMNGQRIGDYVTASSIEECETKCLETYH